MRSFSLQLKKIKMLKELYLIVKKIGFVFERKENVLLFLVHFLFLLINDVSAQKVNFFRI